MAIAVEHALKLPKMKIISVVAGKTGLWREISTVNMMEVPDISRYLKRGELLITTMYPIRDNETLQRELIPLLYEKGVAALILLPLYEHSNIPDFMIVQADALGFPLLSAPYGTAFNDIMTPILHSILKESHRSELIGDILNGKITSLSQALAIGRSFNWNLEGAFIPVVAHGSISLKFPPHVIVVALDDCTVLLFPLNNIKHTKKRMDEIVALLETYKTLHIGIGRMIENIIELPKGFAQAAQAIKITKQSKQPQYVACYDNLGIYRVLFSGEGNEEKQFFANEVLGAIMHDPVLIETLKVYFDKMGNYRNAAKALYVHHNTVANRLARIEQLTGMELTDPENYLCLQVALKITGFLNGL